MGRNIDSASEQGRWLLSYSVFLPSSSRKCSLDRQTCIRGRTGVRAVEPTLICGNEPSKTMGVQGTEISSRCRPEPAARGPAG